MVLLDGGSRCEQRGSAIAAFPGYFRPTSADTFRQAERALAALQGSAHFDILAGRWPGAAKA
jgi:hypothetical protein